MASETLLPRRRLSRLTSGGREDWSYTSALAPFEPAASSSSLVSFPISLHRPAAMPAYRFMKQKPSSTTTTTPGTLSIDLPRRHLVVHSFTATTAITSSSSSSYSSSYAGSPPPPPLAFPLSCISRMNRIEPHALEIKTAIPSLLSPPSSSSSSGGSGYISFKVDFASVEQRDELCKLVRMSNCLGGMVSQLYAQHVQPARMKEDDKNVAVLLSSLPCLRGEDENENGEEETTVPPPPHSPLDEGGFIKWFLQVMCAYDSVDASTLRQQVMLAMGKEEEEALATRTSIRGVQQPKRGVVVRNLVLQGEAEESLVCQEDFVMLLPGGGAGVGKEGGGGDERAVFGRPVLGELFVTSHELFFSMYYDASGSSGEVGVLPSLRRGRRPQPALFTVRVPLPAITRVRVVPSSQSVLEIRTLLVTQRQQPFRFMFDRDNKYVAHFCRQLDDLLVQQQQRPFKPLSSPSFYSESAEFARQGMTTSTLQLVDNNGVCATYPNKLCLPKNSSIAKAAQFRSRARLPSVTWLAQGAGGDKVTLSRSSQPMSGVLSRTNRWDEELLKALHVRYIVDCRGPLAVLGNTLVRGKGAETPARYAAPVLFQGIGNIHTMRNALEAAAQGPQQWLGHVRAVASAALRVAEMLSLERASVLVHCSDGWDRTAQVVALAQLVLDPHFRTVRGFASLVEKDFVSFGFQFHKRTFGRTEERSPIWPQFLECVWQLMRQHPRAFEFNADLLVYLTDAPLARRFPTLAFDSVRERDTAVGGAAHGLWAFVCGCKEFRNAAYDSETTSSSSSSPLWVDVHGFARWTSWHDRFDAAAAKMDL